MSSSHQSGQDLLCSLIESRAIGPAIKTVLDRGWQSTYNDFLTANIEAKDATIKGVCNDHYQEFISAIDSVITVKIDIQELKKDIEGLNRQVQSSGEDFIKKANKLMELRKTRSNLNGAIELLRNCQYLMSLAAKAKQQIDEHKFFSALKTLDQLQRLHLPKFSNYDFAQHLERQIPLMIRSVKDSATTEFDIWLGAIREKSKKLGSFILSEAKSQKDDQERSPLAESKLDEFSLFEKFDIDFASVYQCLHIYENLRIAHEFHKLYREKRKGQAEQILHLRTMTPKEFETQHEAYFAQLMGFFVIEDAVMKSGNGDGLFQRTDLENLWEHSLASIKVVLRTQIGYINELPDLLKIQQVIVLFCCTLSSYGMHVEPLYHFLYEERKKFESLLAQQLAKRVANILESERFEPLYLPTSLEYDKQVLAFELQDPSVNVEFPATMPFSKIVPEVCQAMQWYVQQYHTYAKDLPHMGDAIEKGVDAELMEVNNQIHRILSQENSLHISQVVQFSINASFLAVACSWIHKETAYNNTTPSSSTLAATGMFQQTKMRCEDLLFELLTAKIDQFMGLASSINWLPSQCATVPSEFIVDCVTYLECTLPSMTNMSDPIREAIHFTTCKHISSYLVDTLLAAKKFNIISIYNLNIDLQELEQFATRCSIPDLGIVFSELRQFIDLLLFHEFECITDPNIRQTKFSHLSSEKLIKMMSRYKDISLFGSLPQGVGKLKKKDVDLALKKLKQQEM